MLLFATLSHSKLIPRCVGLNQHSHDELRVAGDAHASNLIYYNIELVLFQSTSAVGGRHSAHGMQSGRFYAPSVFVYP